MNPNRLKRFVGFHNGSNAIFHFEKNRCPLKRWFSSIEALGQGA
jgi:hypothetical protein